MFGNWPKLTLARVGGFPIRLDATFLIVPLLFISRLPSQSETEMWFLVTLLIVGTFLSVLLHELGHALTARRSGIGVQEVVIGGFYGYARMMPQRTTRLTVLGITIAGPLANLVIFLILWTLLSFPSFDGMRVIAAIGMPPTLFPQWLARAVAMLAIINLAMFVFNLFPAYPLDGGRIADLLLGRLLGPQRGLWVSSLIGAAIGLAVVIYSAGFSIFLLLIGVFIIVVNISRLRRPRAQPRPPRPDLHGTRTTPGLSRVTNIPKPPDSRNIRRPGR